ncbi:MAG TPA: hypothetical protein VGB97_01575 [Candidatus Paceibacterota bacterium]|jgi:hypothetical protein
MPPHTFSWIFAAVVTVIGILNILLVHPVPGIVYLLLSLVYLPPMERALKARFGLSIPRAFKILLGLAIIWFTLGISDLGDMID